LYVVWLQWIVQEEKGFYELGGLRYKTYSDKGRSRRSECYVRMTSVFAQFVAFGGTAMDAIDTMHATMMRDE
jgi:hypothetical protein